MGSAYAISARILEPSEENLGKLVLALRAGDLVAIPTETVYGLAAIATHERAVSEIFAVKERPHFDPLIVHLPLPTDQKHWTVTALGKAGWIRTDTLGAAAQEKANLLMREFWPGPLTIVLPRAHAIPDLVTSGTDTVALRVPAHPVTQKLLNLLQAPLAAPSANRFGRISPTTASAVMSELGGRIPWILDGGPCQVGVESTVVRVTGSGSIELLRPGGLSVERLQLALGSQAQILRPAAITPKTTGSSTSAVSPGLLESHYAPHKVLALLPSPIDEIKDPDLERWSMQIRSRIGDVPAAVLLLKGTPEFCARVKTRLQERAKLRIVEVRALSSSGSETEMAQRFFATLRDLDELSSSSWLIAEPCPGTEGLLFAIGDRLKRAAARANSIS